MIGHGATHFAHQKLVLLLVIFFEAYVVLPLVQRSYLTGLFSSYYTTSVNGHGAKLFVLQPAVQIAVNKTANASAVYADQLPDFGNDANVRTFWQSTNGPFQVGNPYWQVRLQFALTMLVEVLATLNCYLRTVISHSV